VKYKNKEQQKRYISNNRIMRLVLKTSNNEVTVAVVGMEIRN
jgi:hypothetical protein